MCKPGERTSSLIQDQNLAVLDHRAREGDERALSDRQVAALVLDRRVEGEARLRRLHPTVRLALNGEPLPVLHEVRALERIPELRIVMLAERIEVGAQGARDCQKQRISMFVWE